MPDVVGRKISPRNPTHEGSGEGLGDFEKNIM